MNWLSILIGGCHCGLFPDRVASGQLRGTDARTGSQNSNEAASRWGADPRLGDVDALGRRSLASPRGILVRRLPESHEPSGNKKRRERRVRFDLPDSNSDELPARSEAAPGETGTHKRDACSGLRDAVQISSLRPYSSILLSGSSALASRLDPFAAEYRYGGDSVIADCISRINGRNEQERAERDGAERDGSKSSGLRRCCGLGKRKSRGSD